MTAKLKLINTYEVRIRFSEVDSMGILWHGNYIKLMEDGREAWGLEFGMHYLDVYHHQTFTPIVETNIKHKTSLRYGDVAVIETEYEDSEAAKLIYHYRIYRQSDMQLVAVAKSIQVFTNLQHQLILSIPEYFAQWKNQMRHHL
jgi:acyl-CoA thioester hydrolase